MGFRVVVGKGLLAGTVETLLPAIGWSRLGSTPKVVLNTAYDCQLLLTPLTTTQDPSALLTTTIPPVQDTAPVPESHELQRPSTSIRSHIRNPSRQTLSRHSITSQPALQPHGPRVKSTLFLQVRTADRSELQRLLTCTLARPMSRESPKPAPAAPPAPRARSRKKPHTSSLRGPPHRASASPSPPPPLSGQTPNSARPQARTCSRRRSRPRPAP